MEENCVGMYDSRSATRSSVTYQGSVRRLCCQVRVRITRVFSNSMPATLLPQQFGVSRWSFQQLWSLTHANPTHYTCLSFHHSTRKHQHICFSFNLDELLGERPCYRTANYVPTRIHRVNWIASNCKDPKCFSGVWNGERNITVGKRRDGESGKWKEKNVALSD